LTGAIQFNRIARNTIGIAAATRQLIAHNLIYRNDQDGILIHGQNDVRLVSNTFYAPTGDNIHIDSGSSNIEVRDNILWATAGTDIYVADDSHAAFSSDYNDLYATGTGVLVHWDTDFSDLFDWQADIAQFDLHSIGRTVVHPGWSEPRFFGGGMDDYRMFDVTARLRFSSPTVDAGDPLTDQGVPGFYQNLLANAGLEAGLGGWNSSPAATVQSANP